MKRICWSFYSVLLAVLVNIGQLEAQAPNTQPPTMDAVFPGGIQRGTSLDLDLTGSHLQDPVTLWTSFPAKATFPTDKNNGKEPGKLRVHLEVPADAPVGTHAIRLVTAAGVSNLRIFCIDDLPQVLKEPNHKTSPTAQEIPEPAVVCGRIEAEAADWYKVKVQAGQHLSFDLLGRRLGSALDAQLTLKDAKTGRELPGGYSNDAPGLQTDPQLSFTFKEAGEVLIEVRDVTYRGAPDFHYRLRIGDFPLVTTPLPMAIKRGSKATIRFAGIDGERATPVDVQAPIDASLPAIWVTPRGKTGPSGWPVSVPLSDLAETLEQEPNNEAAKANRIPVPGAVTGRLEKRGDRDFYVFSAKKGQRLFIQADSHEFHSPTEVYMVLRDAKGMQLQTSNPMTVTRLDFTPTEDGDYSLAVEHLHLWGGPAETYRIAIVPHQPRFELTVATDRFDIAPGTTKNVPITVVRQDYAGPVEARVIGQGLSGQVTIAQGQNSGTLPVVASEAVVPGVVLSSIAGKAMIENKEFSTWASIRTPLSQGLANLPVPPRPWYNQLAMGIITRPPMTLGGKLDGPTAHPGKSINLTVTATRIGGFGGEVMLSTTGLPPEVTASTAVLPAGQNQAVIKLTIGEKVVPGTYPITITGKSKHHNGDFSQTTSVSLVIKKG